MNPLRRIVEMFGRTRAGAKVHEDESASRENVAGQTPAAEPAANAQAEEGPIGPLARWKSNRNQALERLQIGYERLLALCETIDGHLQSQRQQQELVANSLERLSTAVQQMPDLLAEQGAKLDNIAAQVAQAANGASRLAEAIDQMIPTQRSQNDLLASVNQQLQRSAQSSDQLAEVLVELKTTLQSLTQSSQEQGRLLSELATDIQQRDSQISDLLQRQAKIVIWLFVAAATLGAVALVVSLALR